MKIGFEDVLIARTQPHAYIIINTLPIGEQKCLIVGTVPADDEERVVMDAKKGLKGGLLAMLAPAAAQTAIVVYGRNSSDVSVEKKCAQLTAFGFTRVYAYVGGMFEWLMLQEIHGVADFPTTNCADFLSYRPRPMLTNALMITNN